VTQKRRYLMSAVVLATCIFATLCVLAMLSPRPGVTKVNVDRVKIGMPREEVQAIFGYEGIIRPAGALGWQHDNGSYVECHFQDDKVSRIEWSPFRETVFEMIHRWRYGPRPKIEAAD
jgi:hypothetical protein